MGKLSAWATLSLTIVALILGTTLGFYLSPVYQQNMYNKEGEMGLGNADKNLDLRYLNAMIKHHRGAILLAEQIDAKTERPELHELAREVQTTEPKLIYELENWKKAWYNESQGVTDPEVANLSQKDDKVDLRFLNALIAHHEAGIEMTKEVRGKTSRVEILNNADAVENFLKESLVMLKNWRKNWYNV